MNEEQEKRNQIHDNYYDVFKIIPTDEQINKVIEILPDEIKGLTLQ